MKRQSWNDKQTARLSAELRERGNTREVWEEICELHDLPALQAGELAAQVRPVMRLEVEPEAPKTIYKNFNRRK